jgi:hypothetical protein
VKRLIGRLKFRRVSTDAVAAGVALLAILLLQLVDSQGDKSHLLLKVPLQMVAQCVFIVVLLRFGLFAIVVAETINQVTERMPLTLNGAALYSGPAWVLLGLIFLVAAVGFWMGRGGEVRSAA